MSLTSGAVAKILNGEKITARLQVTTIKPIISGGVASRYRMLLTDGQSKINGMLSTQHNQLITNNVIVENSIIEINDFMTNEVGGQITIVLLNLNVVDNNENSLDSVTESSEIPPSVSQANPITNQSNVNFSSINSIIYYYYFYFYYYYYYYYYFNELIL
jgi:hypothetical protein